MPLRVTYGPQTNPQDICPHVPDEEPARMEQRDPLVMRRGVCYGSPRQGCPQQASQSRPYVSRVLKGEQDQPWRKRRTLSTSGSCVPLGGLRWQPRVLAAGAQGGQVVRVGEKGSEEARRYSESLVGTSLLAADIPGVPGRVKSNVLELPHFGQNGQELWTTPKLIRIFDKQRLHRYRESQQFFGIKIHPGTRKQLHPLLWLGLRKPLLLERPGPSRAWLSA